MAYREFYQRQDIIQPDYSALERGITGLFAGIAHRQEKKRMLAEKFNYELKGGFESDQQIFNELAKNVTENTIRNGGIPDYNTRLVMAQGKGWAEMSEIQRKRAEDLNKRIDDLAGKNKYYDATKDYLALQKISDPEVNFQTRGQILDDVEKNIGNARNFKTSNYLADYVKDRQRSFKEKTYGTPDAKNTKYDESTFWDEKTGKPGVTDEHAIDLLKSNSLFNENINLSVQDQIKDEISRMKNSGDSRVSWMKGMSDDEIMNQLIQEPSKNILNNKNFGERVRSTAKRELEKFNAIDSRTSYEKKESSTATGPIKNDAIGHSNTFFNNRIETEGVSDPVANAFRMNSVAGPGGLLMIGKGVASTGKPLKLPIDSNQSFNLRTGKNTPRNTGEFNVTGYQLQVYDKNGNLYPIQANSIEELSTAIQNLPTSVLKNLNPEMKVAITGWAVDEQTMLGDLANKSFSISEQIAETTDPDKKAELEDQLNELKRLRGLVNLEGISDEDIILAANKAGIKKIKQDQILLPNESDLDRIKATTGGLDLKNKEHWSPEMKQINDLYKSRYQQAQTETPKPKNTGRVISSDGSDIDSWSTNNQYKVGNNTYFYDRNTGQWSKK